MAEPKNMKYEAEVSLPVKLKPAPRSTGKPPRREEEHAAAAPGKPGQTERKDVILRIIDYLESL